MPSMITKPNNLFDKGELEEKYRVFMEKTAAIRADEELRQERMDAIALQKRMQAAQ